MNSRLTPVTLGDDFVLEQLMQAKELPSLVSLPPAQMVQVGRRIKNKIQRCLSLFRKHHGVSRRRHRPEYVQQLEKLLIPGLNILGRVLNLEKAISCFEHLIETDWKAHVELAKEKRYRDHITHPIRVTAIGWWLLHREDGKLLDDLAEHYKCETANYRGDYGIDISSHDCDWKAIVEYAWLACGLLHDSAYPQEYHLRAGERRRKNFGDACRILALTLRTFSTDSTRQDILSPLGGSWFANQGPNLNARLDGLCQKERFKHAHALLGALHHLRSLGTKLHSLQGLVVQLAAQAIVTHHDKSDCFILSDPLSLLLYVADNLQAWQRPFLHREEDVSPSGIRTIRPIVECKKIKLVAAGNGYLAKFRMNCEEMAVLKKRPYKWDFEKFKEPNERVECLIKKHELLPQIILSEPCCIQPPEFRYFFDAHVER